MKKKSRPLLVFFTVLGVVVFLYVVLGFLFMIGEWTFQAAWAFLSGWVTYPKRILPEITYNWEMILCGLGALAMAMFFAHHFLRWLAEKVPAIPAPWQFRTTAILSLLLLSMFGTSVAMTGIIHQTAWLGTAPELTRNRGISITSMQVMEAKDLLSSLYLNAETQTSKHFPETLILPDKKTGSDFRFASHLCEYGKGDSEPWLYPAAGMTLGDEAFPVIISPRPNREGQIVVAYSNFVVANHSFDELPPQIAEFFR